MTSVFDGLEAQTLIRGDGVDHRISVRAATTAAVDLGSDFDGAIMDGVTLAVGDRFLVKDAPNSSQVSTLDFSGVTNLATELGGFQISIDSTTVQYYVWWDVDNTDADPVGTGTGIEVDIAAADTVVQIATKTAAAINAVGGAGVVFISADPAPSSIVTIFNTVAGPPFVAAPGVTATTTTNVTVDLNYAGFTGNTIANGIYEVLMTGANGTFRAEDLVTDDDASFIIVDVQEGTAYSKTQWTCTSLNSASAIIDTDPNIWTMSQLFDYVKGTIFYGDSTTEIAGLAPPTATSVLQIDAAGNVTWVARDNIDAGLDWKESARACTLTDINATYAAGGGTGGTGAFTAVDLTDGNIFDLEPGGTPLVLAIGDRLLIKEQGVAEIQTVDVGALTAAGLAGTYFTLNSHDASYYVWFDLDNGSVDPAPMGLTPIEINLAAATHTTPQLISDKIVTDMTAFTDFTVTNAGGTTTVTTITNNFATRSNPANIADVDTGMAFSTTTDGVNTNAKLQQNGIYVVTTAGVAGVIERAPDHDESVAGNVSAGNVIFVENGDFCADTQWVLQGDGILTLNTDDIVWVQFGATAGQTLNDNTILIGNGTASIDDTTLAPIIRTTMIIPATGIPEWNSGLEIYANEVRDQNDNALATFTTTAAAVNNVDFTNQITGVQEVHTFDTTGGTPANLDGTYYMFDTPENCYYVWFDLDNTSTDPNPSGALGIEVDIATGDTEAQIATKLQVVLDALYDVTAGVATNLVTATNDEMGAVTNVNTGTIAGATGAVTTVEGVNNEPIIAAVGDDTDIGLSFQAKGLGNYNFLGTATDSAIIKLYEDTDNGIGFVGLKAPQNITGCYTITLPGEPGDAGDFLQVDGDGNLSFVDIDAAQRISHSIVSQQISANKTALTSVGYFAWDDSEYGEFATGKVIYEADLGNRTFDIDIYNHTTSTVLGSDYGVSADGLRVFTFTLPTADARLCVRVRKTSGGGQNPQVYGIQVEYNSV